MHLLLLDFDPRELLDTVDDAIVFKPMDFNPIRKTSQTPSEKDPDWNMARADCLRGMGRKGSRSEHPAAQIPKLITK